MNHVFFNDINDIKLDFVDIVSSNTTKYFQDIKVFQAENRDFFQDIQFENSLQKMNFIIIFNALNFCFWSQDGQDWMVDIGGKSFSRTSALIECLKLKLLNSPDFFQAKSIKTTTSHEFKDFLLGGKNLQLIDERYNNFLEVGRVLDRNFDGEFKNLVDSANDDIIKLVKLIVEFFPSNNDVSLYKGSHIFFYKRAQVTASQISLFEGYKNKFNNLSKLSAFADYRLPQVLRHIGVLNYDARLSKKVNSKETIIPGSPEEIEIRLATILAVEKIKEICIVEGIEVMSKDIDSFLWQLSQKLKDEMAPHHRTPSVYY